MTIKQLIVLDEIGLIPDYLKHGWNIQRRQKIDDEPIQIEKTVYDTRLIFLITSIASAVATWFLRNHGNYLNETGVIVFFSAIVTIAFVSLVIHLNALSERKGNFLRDVEKLRSALDWISIPNLVDMRFDKYKLDDLAMKQLVKLVRLLKHAEATHGVLSDQAKQCGQNLKSAHDIFCKFNLGPKDYRVAFNAVEEEDRKTTQALTEWKGVLYPKAS